MSQVNQISAVMPQADVDAVLAAIATIKTKMPFLISLTAEERQGMVKMGDKTVAFVNKATEYAGQNPDMVPSFLDVPELKKDLNLVNALSTIERQLNPLAKSLEDTLMLSASEAYVGSLSFYGAAKQAAKFNVPGAGAIAADLGERFQGRSKGTTPTPPPANP